MLNRILPVAVFMALCVLLFVGLRMADQKDIIPSPLIGKPAPEFALSTLDGDQLIRRDDLLGQPYLLNVWASWCPGCRVEHEQITAIAESGLLPVIGLNYKDAEDDARRWLNQFGNPYQQILVDADGKVGIDFGVYGAPETFLVDADGIIRFKQVGILDQRTWETSLRPLIQSLPGDES
ncbi:MAG: DsbE family thiol:disulfide interchange protein [Gammaproteobacteria bacterium]|nr:DsbE family thiol:disulfide interchange protein [Gammaproteobacteria bacterium]